MLLLCMTSAIESKICPRYLAPSVDASLLQEVAGGSRDALSRLYEQAGAAVYGFALSILKNPHSAEDVMQETFLQVFSSARSYQGRGKPMAWILTIARNLSLMKLREQKRISQTPLEEMWDLQSGDKGLEKKEDKILLDGVLQSLTEEERQILMLHATSGLKHREIAAMLKLPLPTVLSKYRRALLKLEKRLKEDGVSEG